MCSNIKTPLIFIFIFVFIFISVRLIFIKSEARKNSIIIYDSMTGNTERLAQALGTILQKTSSVKIEKVTSAESNNIYDFSKYDLVALGSPVHYVEFSKRMQEYIEKISGLKEKEIILFVTYGSGIGRHNALYNQEKIIRAKGVNKIKKIAYPGRYTQKTTENIVDVLKIYLSKNNKIDVVPDFIPIMDMYTGLTVKLSGSVYYKSQHLKQRSITLGVWTEKAFKQNKNADVSLISIITPPHRNNEQVSFCDISGKNDWRNFVINVPKNIGHVYLGAIDSNIMHLASAYSILNKAEPIKIEDKDIENINIKVIYNKVFIRGMIKNEGAYLLEEGMKVEDLINKAGGFTAVPNKLVITVHRNQGSKEDIIDIVRRLPAADPEANVFLEIGDHVIVEYER